MQSGSIGNAVTSWNRLWEPPILLIEEFHVSFQILHENARIKPQIIPQPRRY
jgi:hypothetical protein